LASAFNTGPSPSAVEGRRACAIALTKAINETYTDLFVSIGGAGEAGAREAAALVTAIITGSGPQGL
jgi:hypothetical protein